MNRLLDEYIDRWIDLKMNRSIDLYVDGKIDRKCASLERLTSKYRYLIIYILFRSYSKCDLDIHWLPYVARCGYCQVIITIFIFILLFRIKKRV